MPRSIPALTWLLLVGLLAATAGAQVNYPSFPNSSGLTLVGNASTTTGGRLRITPAVNGQAGAAWFTAKQVVGNGFTTTFTFQLGNPHGGGADGFCFMVQNTAANAIGDAANGCRLGYHGIANSLAIEFDTFRSINCSAGDVNDPNGNHVSIQTRGTLSNSVATSASIGLTTAIPNMKDGAIHTAQIVYVPGNIRVFLDNMVTPVLDVPLDLAATLSLSAGGTAWVGFTAATGGADENHDILTWSLTPTTNPMPGDAARPDTPSIEEPGVAGQVLNAADVHMVTADISSPVAAELACSDWEIWKTNPPPLTRVWRADCATGALAVHIHLGDGVFEGPYVGRTTLEQGPDFVLRVRHRDDSSNPLSEYSRCAVRPFRTALPDVVQPFETDDLADPPAPVWVLDAGGPVILPDGARLELGSAQGELLLRIAGSASGNQATNPSPLATHIPVRVRLAAGAALLSLESSTLTVVDHHCVEHTIYLPEIDLGPGAEALFWVSTSGATYYAQPTETGPVFIQLARAAQIPWDAHREGYVVERFATGFQLPVNIAFVPSPGPAPTDPFFYVTELYGQIMMVTRAGAVSVYAGNLLNFNPTGLFPGSGEVGLAGLVIEPTTGDLFATMLYATVTGNPSQLRPRIVRFSSNDGGRTAASQTVIRDFPTEPQGQSHQISNITIGPDGKLYVHMGDGFSAATAQNLDSARGKILRMNLDGSAPSDNPHYNAADGITARDLVWVSGVRNPFGGAWRLSDGTHFTVENGPSVDRLFLSVRGRNYLYTGSDASMTNFAAYNWTPSKGPVNIVFQQSGPGLFSGGFPGSSLGHAFVTESGPTYASGPQTLGKRIVEFVIATDGTVQSGPTTLVEYSGTGKGTAVGLAFGPDGLYFTDLYKDMGAATPIERGASVLRVRYLGPDGACAPPCPADFNGSGDVTVQDIFDFLAAYFTQDARADFNMSGTVTVQDIFDYLSAYFIGCP